MDILSAPTDAAAWGTPPWRCAAAVEPDAPPLEVDVAVVGAGFTGLAAALELAAADLSVVVLEAATLGAGASGRSGGIALEDTAAGVVEGFGGCLPALRALLEREQIHCDLALGGCLEVEHGAPGPAPSWPDAGRHVVGRQTLPGGTLDPGRLVGGLARAARRRGARLHEHTPVVCVESGGPGVRLTLAGGAALAARGAVLAPNAFAAALRGARAPEPIHAALTFALRVEAPALETLSLGGPEAFYTVDQPYLWGRRHGRDAWILGAGLLRPAPDDGLPADLSHPLSRERFASLEERTRGLHPALRDARVTHRWAGPVAFTETRRPLLARPPGVDRAVLAGGLAGHGVALGCRIGTLAARAVLEQLRESGPGAR